MSFGGEINTIFRFAIMLVTFSFVGKANGQTYYVGVGESLTLDVPSVSVGTVDKAIWACSNPAISFVYKSTTSAKIRVQKSFEGYATIELVYVASYVDKKGFTRANTYTKNFFVSCKGGSGGDSSKKPTSISVEPEIRVAVDEKAKIHYRLYPEGSKAEVWSSRWPGKYFFGLTMYPDDGYVEGVGRYVGTERVTVYFYKDGNEEEKVSATCKVTVYDPSWIEPQSVSIPNTVLLSVGEKKKLLPLLTPNTATTLFEWSSDNTSVVSVSEGNVVAKCTGIANVTLKATNGLTTRCIVIVMEDKNEFPGLYKALNRVSKMIESSENENIK